MKTPPTKFVLTDVERSELWELIRSGCRSCGGALAVGAVGAVVAVCKAVGVLVGAICNKAVGVGAVRSRSWL